MNRGSRASREQRIGAMADYLIGHMKVEDIGRKWGVSGPCVSHWASQISDHFKLRKTRKIKKPYAIKRQYLEAA